MTRNGVLAGMAAGAVIVVVWAQFKPTLWNIYEILPGFIAASLAIAMASLLDREPSREIRGEFAKA